MGASPSAGIFSEWVTRIYRRYNVLVGREVFSSLDEEYEKQVNEGSDVSLNREDQRTIINMLEAFTLANNIGHMSLGGACHSVQPLDVRVGGPHCLSLD